MIIKMIKGKFETIVDGTKDLPQDHPHNVNIQYLEQNPQLKMEIEDQVHPIVNDLLVGKQPYIISGKAAVTVCDKLALKQDVKNHGYVGSLLFEILLSTNDLREAIGYREKSFQHSVTYFLS